MLARDQGDIILCKTKESTKEMIEVKDNEDNEKEAVFRSTGNIKCTIKNDRFVMLTSTNFIA